MKKTMLAPIGLTDDQRKWLSNEAKRSGNSMSAVVRILIDEAMKNEHKNK